MFIWNAGTTWWIWNASVAGAIFAIVANSFLMCIPLWGFHVFRSKFGNRIGLLTFVVFWLSFEYIHLNWQLSWPWLTLGNVFASSPEWVQWYEYTGTSGGSLWVLTMNVLVFLLITQTKTGARKPKIILTIVAAAVLVTPFLISYAVTPSPQTINQPSVHSNVIIVQPNIDPYNEKFAAGSAEMQIQKLISLSEKGIDTNTRLIIWPETALPVSVMQNELQQSFYYRSVFDFVARHPNVTLQTGLESLRNYGTEKATNTARKNESDGTYYDAFNASVSIVPGQALQFYNKSKLVPGVETLPDFMLWLGAIFEKFGGTAGGYGKDKEVNIFSHSGNPYVTAPIICYESIYGEYVAEYVRKGANLLTVMTNDGWWANTPGHRQHLNYARLRAIETRRWVARSANTGISAVIDEKGNLAETRQWAETGFIKYNIPALTGETFFVRNGDLISPVALLLMGLLLIWRLVIFVKNRRNRVKR